MNKFDFFAAMINGRAPVLSCLCWRDVYILKVFGWLFKFLRPSFGWAGSMIKAGTTYFFRRIGFNENMLTKSVTLCFTTFWYGTVSTGQSKWYLRTDSINRANSAILATQSLLYCLFTYISIFLLLLILASGRPFIPRWKASNDGLRAGRELVYFLGSGLLQMQHLNHLFSFFSFLDLGEAYCPNQRMH